MRLFPALMLVTGSAALAQTQARYADLVLRNGKIVTLDARNQVVQALAVKGDRIMAVGSVADAKRWIGPSTKVVELGGKLAIPGFIEGHGHFTGIGEFRLGLDLPAGAYLGRDRGSGKAGGARRAAG